MTSTSTRIGYRELNAVLDDVRRGRSPTGVSDDQLLGLQYRWTTTLSARLDQAIEFTGGAPLIDAVALAWHQLAAEQATLRAVLDAAEHRCAALRAATRTECRYLALAAGLVGLDDPVDEVARLGREYRDMIRSGALPSSPRVSTSSAVTRAVVHLMPAG
jgi:hypothetical protein